MLLVEQLFRNYNMKNTGEIRMHNLFVNTRKIYSALCDEISKKIFLARVNASITGDRGFIELTLVEIVGYEV